MKVLKNIFVAVVIVLILPSLTYAREVIKDKTDGTRCLDLQEAYADIYDTSKALTGMDNSVDAIKRAETVSSLTNVLSIFTGDRIYCVNDEVAASKVNSLKQEGILGALDDANNTIFAAYPTVGVGNHLAEMFIPGYKGENDLLAKSAQEKIVDKLVDQTDDIIEFTEEESSVVEIPTQDSSSGYKYLKEDLQLDSVWELSRNLAYLFFIVVVIIIGFAIMFRKKLPGQVMVSLGNTIPHVAIGIVLVTFSFAIVGFIMDLGKVTMVVAGNIFERAYQDIGVQQDSEDIISVENVGDLTNQALEKSKEDGPVMKLVEKIPFVGKKIKREIQGTTGTLSSIGSQSLLLFGIHNASKAARGNEISINTHIPIVDVVIGTAVEVGEMAVDLQLAGVVEVGLTVLLIRNLLLCIVCVYASFKLFLTLITTYFKLFINVVAGPLQILVGSLPGNFSATINWLKSVVANVLVFVGVFVVVNLFAFLSKSIDPASFNFFGNKGIMWPNWIISLDGVILIAGYLFAAGLPKVINGALKVGASKEMSMAGESIKKSMSKIPLVGGMFGS